MTADSTTPEAAVATPVAFTEGPTVDTEGNVYTTRNSLPVGAELRAGVEVLDDRTIRFRGKDILEAWSLYRSR